MSEPSKEEDDWLLEEEVLLFEMVEWGLLKEVACSKEGTAMEALVLDSAGRNELSGFRNINSQQQHFGFVFKLDGHKARSLVYL